MKNDIRRYIHKKRTQIMLYEQTLMRLNAIDNIKTADIDLIAKEYYQSKIDVAELYPYLSKNSAIHRIYFYVSLKSIKKYEDQISFIEDHFSDLHDWWHVDFLLQLLTKAPSFSYVYEKAKQYIQSELTFVRRWGYVIFLSGWQKDRHYTLKILALLHNDQEHYVQMAEAWLLADLAIYNPEVVIDFIKSQSLHYKIIGKGIQKICDSFRINDEFKIRVKALRSLYK